MELMTFISENVLQLLMMLIGFGLLVLEIYLPGFGVAGISGSVGSVGATVGAVVGAGSVVAAVAEKVPYQKQFIRCCMS